MLHSWFCRPRGWPAAALLLPALAACGRGSGDAPASGSSPNAARSAPALAVRDDAGRLVVLSAPAHRVISLVPAQTGIIKRLAGAGVLAARTVWDTDPDLASLPHTENALAPSVEWLAALHPDLVIAWPDRDARDLIARLAALGIPVYASATQSLADIDSAIARLGVLLGQEARADSLRAGIRAGLDAVRARVAGAPRPAVLYAVAVDPPLAAGNGTWIGELLALAGGRNSFADLRTLWPQVSLEEIVRRQPEVIIRPVEDPGTDVLAELRRRPGWRELPAVRAGRVHAVDANLLNRPGAEVGEAALVLARAIHPDRFPGPR